MPQLDANQMLKNLGTSPLAPGNIIHTEPSKYNCFIISIQPTEEPTTQHLLFRRQGENVRFEIITTPNSITVKGGLIKRMSSCTGKTPLEVAKKLRAIKHSPVWANLALKIIDPRI